MNPELIPLAELVPDEVLQASAERMFARAATLDEHAGKVAYSGVYAETLVDALDDGDAEMVAAAVRVLVAHVRAGQARRRELDAAAREAAR
jgi:hypothetical protein